MGNQASWYRQVMWWFKKKNIKTEIPSPKVDERYRIYSPKLWPYRFAGNILILSAIAAATFGIFVIKSNFVAQKLTSFSDYFIELTTKMGFTVDDILVYGRKKTPLNEINNVINLHRGDNIFGPNIHQLKADLEQLPWVKSAIVERLYSPNIIRINLIERQIVAIWQIRNNFHPVDIEGKVIDTDKVPPTPLLLIIGRKAPEHLQELFDLINIDEELRSRIKAANFISGRRWNIILDDLQNGITIKLPAENADTAWKRLIKLNQTRGILKRKLTIIDLRFENKVLVTPKKNTTKAYFERKQAQEHGV